MDLIRSESQYNKDNFIRLNLVLFKIKWLKFQKQLRGMTIASITFLFLGFLVRTQSEPFNPFILIGIVFSVLTAFFYFILISAKKSYSRQIKIIAEKLNEQKMDCTYELSDDSLKYWDKEKHFDFKWTVFAHYSIYKNYLLIGLGHPAFNPFIFEEKDSENNDYNRILDLVKTKLEYKEIK